MERKIYGNYWKNKWFISKSGAWFIFKGERYKILKAIISEKEGEPGIVLDDYLEIACNDKSIKILKYREKVNDSKKLRSLSLDQKIKKGSNLNNA